MFTYARGPALKRMMDAKVEGASVDDWLEGWTVGTLREMMDGKWPARVLDIEIGDGQRLYRDNLSGPAFTGVSPSALATVSQTFDLVLALSFERAECLAPVNPERAYDQAYLLGAAARLLSPGGLLIWSYLYAYAEDEAIHSLLEPAALFRNLTLRGLEPLDGSMGVREKVRLYHDPETLFVNQRAVLEHSDRQRRIVRVLGAVRSPQPPAQAAPIVKPATSWWTRWRNGS